MHTLSGGLVLGYRGCDERIGEALLRGESFGVSSNPWDWLGPGAYFWEANPKRGFDFAVELKTKANKHNKIETPFVIGAVINPGLCLDLSTKAGIEIVRDARDRLADIYTRANKPLPVNRPDVLQRNLDCAVIQQVHDLREEQRVAPMDTVRGVFIEGEPIYPDSGFYDKTHIQMAVKNLDCIKGVFRVLPALYE